MLTRLDAINQCLDAIGEEPVSSLASGLDDAARAERALDKVSREVQEKGWQCNRDENFKLVPNNDGLIQVPSNVLRIDTVGRSKMIDVTVRQRSDGNHYLYNIKTQSFKFDGPVYVDIIWQFDFEGLTPALQMYIAAKAAREYQESEMGSVNLDSFARRQEMEAWAALLDAEAEAEDSNILTQSTHCAWITGRLNPLYGT